MTRDEILTGVERIVAGQIDAAGRHEAVSPDILRDESLLDLGADELDTVEILMRAEEVFGVELSDGDITLISTVSDIAAAVTRSAKTASSPGMKWTGAKARR